MKPKKPKKPKKCKSCGAEFIPARTLQAACSVRCAIELSRKKTEKEQERAAKKMQRERRERVKKRADWLKEAQQAFNAWIRERDYDQPCISCGRHHRGQYHAGHYRTVGSCPDLRFEPMNCHKQCAPCNNHKSGDIVNYRMALINRIGSDQVEWLEGPHDPKKYTIDELKLIKSHYRKLAQDMAKKRLSSEKI